MGHRKPLRQEQPCFVSEAKRTMRRELNERGRGCGKALERMTGLYEELEHVVRAMGNY